MNVIFPHSVILTVSSYINVILLPTAKCMTFIKVGMHLRYGPWALIFQEHTLMTCTKIICFPTLTNCLIENGTRVR